MLSKIDLFKKNYVSILSFLKNLKANFIHDLTYNCSYFPKDVPNNGKQKNKV